MTHPHAHAERVTGRTDLLRVHNRDDRRHRVAVRLYDGRELVRTERYRLAPGERARTHDRLPPGRYEAVADLADGGRERTRFRVAPAAERALRVRVEGGRFRVSEVA